MNDGEALYAAILREPAEDIHRIVYADWLQENGQSERAEFIRVQCELAREGDRICPYACSSRIDYRCRWCCLRDRQRQLFASNYIDWLLFLPGCMQCAPVGKTSQTTVVVWGPRLHIDQTFVRGFIEHITCTAADWLKNADAIIANHPVTKVTLTTFPLFEIGILQDQDKFRIPGRSWILTHTAYRQSSERQVPLCIPALEIAWPGIEFVMAERNAVATGG